MRCTPRALLAFITMALSSHVHASLNGDWTFESVGIAKRRRFEA